MTIDLRLSGGTRGRRFGAVLAAGALVLAACGGDDDPTESSATASSEADASDASGGETSETAAPGDESPTTEPETTSATGDGDGDGASELVAQLPAASGDVDVIRWNLTRGEPSSIDPRLAADYSAGQVVENLCDSLVGMDADFNLTPGLATWEQTSPTELVFTIRDDATFWDGTAVTAEDVAYSLQRSADPASIVSIFFGSVAAIEATGPYEVTVTFTQPDVQFISEMANLPGLVVQRAFAEQAGEAFGTPDGGLMCGGPFKLDSWTSGQSIVISRNDDYWNAEARPFAAQVEFSFITDSTALTQAIQAGEIDGAYELPASILPALQDVDGGRVVFGPSTQSVGLSVAGPGGVLANVDLRTALQLGIDREALATVVFNGAARPLYTALTPGTWPNDQRDLYQAAYDLIAAERAFDPAAAAALVEQSGYDGTPIVIATLAGDETAARTAQVIQQQAADAGLTIEIKPLQPLDFSQAGFDPAFREGIDLMLGSAFNASQEPLEPLGFTYLPETAFYNYTGYDNPEVTELIRGAKAELDPVKRAEMIIAAQAIFEPAELTIPLLAQSAVTYLANDLTGAITSFAYWMNPQMAFIGAAS